MNLTDKDFSVYQPLEGKEGEKKRVELGVCTQLNIAPCRLINALRCCFTVPDMSCYQLS